MKQATIVIKDEVNIKIEGLDLDARKALVKAFKYELPYARHMPAVRLGRWDGTVADLIKVSESNWKALAASTCMKNS
jgi:hypothetical protein